MFNRLLAIAAASTLALAMGAQGAAAQTAAAQTAAPQATPPATSAAPAAGTVNVVAHGDIIETLRNAGQFTVFIRAADATNLTPVLKNNQGLTVFAPTDAAFQAMPGGVDALMRNPPALQKMLTHHIINARVDSSKIKGAKGPVPSVAGDQVMLDGSGDALKVDNATIVQADVMATNGVVHIVDQVLTPGGGSSAAPAAAPASPPAAQ